MKPLHRHSNAVTKASAALLSVIAVLAPSLSAHASAVDAFYERTVMTAADERCRLFSPDLAAALGAAAAQAHGAALRSGMTDTDLDRVEQHAHAMAASVACNSRDIATAADRVRTAFDGYSRMQTMNFQGDTSGWMADRAVSQDYTMWRLSQTQPFGWNSLVFGLAGRGESAGLIAVASFPDGARPYAARLILRDSQRAPQPFLNLIRVSNGGRLPLDARMPPADATRTFFPEARSAADPTLLPRGAASGVAFRFPLAAADAIARLDPREAVAIEFLFADGGEDTARTAYVEVGDFAAGRAFLASAR